MDLESLVKFVLGFIYIFTRECRAVFCYYLRLLATSQVLCFLFVSKLRNRLFSLYEKKQQCNF